MIAIEFTAPCDANWEQWCAECDAEQETTNGLVGDGKKWSPKGDLYKGAKHGIWGIFMSTEGPFKGKCAYCESKIFQSQQGDIDHYRPKALVTDEHYKDIVTDSGAPHPGYYWLTYKWTNLLPSCELCNQPSTKHSSGPIGKRNAFPVRSYRAKSPGEELNEEPLLLNPTVDDPAEHLRIDASGILIGLTDRGEMTIKLLGLNERGLPHERLQAYRRAREKLGLLAQMVASQVDHGSHAAEVLEIRRGATEYSVAGRQGIDDLLAELSGHIGD